MSLITLTKENFDTEAMQAEGLVLIDFWASWCMPCKALSPVIDEIAESAVEGLKVCKVNIDEQQELAERYHIMSIPTLIILKNGKQTAMSGPQSKKGILQMVEEARNK